MVRCSRIYPHPSGWIRWHWGNSSEAKINNSGKFIKLNLPTIHNITMKNKAQQNPVHICWDIHTYHWGFNIKILSHHHRNSLNAVSWLVLSAQWETLYLIWSLYWNKTPASQLHTLMHYRHIPHYVTTTALYICGFIHFHIRILREYRAEECQSTSHNA